LGGGVIYYFYYSNGRQNKMPVGQTLLERVDNGYQYRDVMYTTMKDYIGDPDVKNNSYFKNSMTHLAQDLGVYGVLRHFFQFQPGNSEIVQVYSNPDNLIL